MPNILPYELNAPDSRLARLLLNRYLFATWLCYLTEYQLLTFFVIYQRIGLSNPVNWLLEWLDQILFSFRAVARIQVLGIHMVAYSLLLIRLHEQLPSCHNWRLQRLQEELLIKLCLLAILMSLGYWSSWFYLKYMVDLNADVDVSFIGHYLRKNGVLCGLVYFLTEHLRFGNEVWPLPLIRLETATWQWLYCHHFDLGRTLPRSLLYTIGFAALFWPNMSGDHSASCQLLCLSSCMVTLITVKLNAIKCIFSTVMHEELPLTFQKQQELPSLQSQQAQDRGLPMCLALRADNQLHGFRLQAARDFYMIASAPGYELSELFQLWGILRKRPKNWRALRNALMSNITQFTQLLNECLARQTQPKPKQQSTRCHPNMRLLAPPAPAPSHWSRRCESEEQGPEPQKIPFLSLLEKLQQQLRNCQLSEQVQWFCNCLPVDAKQLMRTDKEDCEVCVGRPLAWLIPGLVSICVRSLKEDKHGSLQQDLAMIFYALIGLEKQIADLLELLERRQQEPCHTLSVLSETLRLSVNKLVYHFNEYLNFILEDELLVDSLRNRL
ncbi:PREDICTED: nucleoporin Ndc1 [Drosophila arizonae]|uniref:Nucleoporin Ndc1 n=1 Tax=Drosophila arizonae TaxID=7263 RepID=A0ABM1PP55_DROAR|nr:PREDICTED: nucleoporin Ndc1 [Drosophila arizonae]